MLRGLLHFYHLIFTRGTTMQHRDLYPHEILQDVIDKSYAKSEGQLKTLAILTFLGGGYVSFGSTLAPNKPLVVS